MKRAALAFMLPAVASACKYAAQRRGMHHVVQALDAPGLQDGANVALQSDGQVPVDRGQIDVLQASLAPAFAPSSACAEKTVVGVARGRSC